MSGAAARSLALVAGLVLGTGCSGEAGLREEALDRGTSPKEMPFARTGSPPRFVDVAEETGLDFAHVNGGSGEMYFVEPVGAGGALVDLDGDDDPDVVLVQSGVLPPGEPSDHPSSPAPGGLRIFRNDRSDSVDGPSLGFADVTPQGIRSLGSYGMGVAAGDFDDDGRIDLYATGFGPNRLLRNVSRAGHIAFEDVTEAAGVQDERWSTSASFVDVDADGRLDLFVVNYVAFGLSTHSPCRSRAGRRDYCGPQSYPPESDRLFWNRGDGTFLDVSGPAGMLDEPGSGLGVVSADFDRDGRIDVYVANDLQRNFLWRNRTPPGGTPSFEEVALQSGAAVSMVGRAEASMGVVAADFDEDGDLDLFMTHLTEETNTMYENDGRGWFRDRSFESGLGAPSLENTGFGTAPIDFDRDGWQDLFVANGAVKSIEERVQAGDAYPLDQPNQLLRNRDGRFVDVSAEAGSAVTREEVGRGVAMGDVDLDGRTDLLVANNSGPARLLLNRTPPAGDWIGLRVVTTTGRDELGAEIDVHCGDRVLRRRVASDGSYLSASDPRVHVGLATGGGVCTATVRHIGGRSETWTDLARGRVHVLRDGTGRTPSDSEHPPGDSP